MDEVASRTVVESSLAVVLARARSTINEWFAEAERIIVQSVGDAEHEASEIVYRARDYARRMVDEARAEAERIAPPTDDGGDGSIDARAMMFRIDGLADTMADVLSSIDQTVAIAGMIAGRATETAALAPGESDRTGQAAQVAAGELDRSISRLFAAVEDMLHSLEEVREAAEGAVTRRPPWESNF